MSRPLLCATVAARSLEELRRLRDEASRVADLVELRLDALDRPEVDAALEGRRGPVLVTCRPRWEGGGFDGAEEARLGILGRAARLGVEYVDVEARADHRPLIDGRNGRGVVLSMHDFEGMPADLRERAATMAASGAEVVKLAVTPRSLGDCLRLREAAAWARGARVAVVGMGPAGLPTRVMPDRFTSCWVYAGDGVAPGQIPASRLVNEFRFREVGASTRVYGVAGRPVFHSLSPAIHNAAFRACGVDAVYLPLETADVDDFLRFAAAFGVAGASVTTPLKVGVFERVPEVDATSRQVGAVNTLSRRGDDGWAGRNTDVEGFLAPLAGAELHGTRAAVLGNGGAARAVVSALASRGAHVAVYGRQLERVEALARAAGVEARVGLPAAGSWDLLVNATPVGTFPDVEASPMRGADLRGGRLVYDLVYNPRETALMRQAARAGCRTIGGLDMLVAQAALQFVWWTGLAAPVDVMRKAAEEAGAACR